MNLDHLEGLKVSLIDEHLLEEFVFGKGTVTATVGEKNGAVTSPSLPYKIKDDETLIIDENHFEIIWKKPKIENELLFVTRNGIDSRYQVIDRGQHQSSGPDE